jgi:hypothetical protein
MLVLIVGFLTMLACLAFQALASLTAARYFAAASRKPIGRRPWVKMFGQFAVLMIVLMLGNVFQIAVWAILYRLIDAVPDWETATYFSGVTFTSLGYGDVVLDGRARLLAPLQAANGLMMFGMTSAVFMAAVQRAIGHWSETHPRPHA